MSSDAVDPKAGGSVISCLRLLIRIQIYMVGLCLHGLFMILRGILARCLRFLKSTRASQPRQQLSAAERNEEYRREQLRPFQFDNDEQRDAFERLAAAEKELLFKGIIPTLNTSGPHRGSNFHVLASPGSVAYLVPATFEEHRALMLEYIPEDQISTFWSWKGRQAIIRRYEILRPSYVSALIRKTDFLDLTSREAFFESFLERVFQDLNGRCLVPLGERHGYRYAFLPDYHLGGYLDGDDEYAESPFWNKGKTEHVTWASTRYFWVWPRLENELPCKRPTIDRPQRQYGYRSGPILHTDPESFIADGDGDGDDEKSIGSSQPQDPPSLRLVVPKQRSIEVPPATQVPAMRITITTPITNNPTPDVTAARRDVSISTTSSSDQSRQSSASLVFDPGYTSDTDRSALVSPISSTLWQSTMSGRSLSATSTRPGMLHLEHPFMMLGWLYRRDNPSPFFRDINYVMAVSLFDGSVWAIYNAWEAPGYYDHLTDDEYEEEIYPDWPPPTHAAFYPERQPDWARLCGPKEQQRIMVRLANATSDFDALGATHAPLMMGPSVLTPEEIPVFVAAQCRADDHSIVLPEVSRDRTIDFAEFTKAGTLHLSSAATG